MAQHRDQRRTREHEGRGKTSGATPGIPLAFVRHGLSFPLLSFFLHFVLSSLFFALSSAVPSLRLGSARSRTRSRLSPLFQPRSHTDINRHRSLTYCLIIGPPREAACFSILWVWERGEEIEENRRETRPECWKIARGAFGGCERWKKSAGWRGWWRKRASDDCDEQSIDRSRIFFVPIPIFLNIIKRAHCK